MTQSNPACEPDLSPKPQAAISGVHTAAEIVEEFSFRHFKPVSNAVFDARVAEQEELRRRGRIAALRDRCNAPPLHWKRWDFDRSGEWGKVEKSVLKRLGKGGLLIALVGLRGNGKTQLAVEAARYTTDVLVQPARFVTITEFFMELRAAYGPMRPRLNWTSCIVIGDHSCWCSMNLRGGAKMIGRTASLLNSSTNAMAI